MIKINCGSGLDEDEERHYPLNINCVQWLTDEIKALGATEGDMRTLG